VKVGTKVKLKGKTKHGKNRVREQGHTWLVVKVKSGLVFAEDMNKEFALLSAENRPDEHWRWVALKEDKNFTMEVVEETEE
jgi:hypothetical protein